MQRLSLWRWNFAQSGPRLPQARRAFETIKRIISVPPRSTIVECGNYRRDYRQGTHQVFAYKQYLELLSEDTLHNGHEKNGMEPT